MHPVHEGVTLHCRGRKTKQLSELTMADHNTQAIYKQVSSQPIRPIRLAEASEASFLGMNIIPCAPQLGVQHLFATTVENS